MGFCAALALLPAVCCAAQPSRHVLWSRVVTDASGLYRAPSLAATQDGVAVSAGDGIAFYSQDGKRLWASKRGGSPVAAYGTHVFISGDRGIDVARIQNGDTISKIGDCAKDDISWLIASQYGLLTGCAEPSTGDIALIAAHTDGSILGRSTFKGGLVDGPQWKPVNANAVWLYGVSSGATLSYRSALVDLANASVVGRPQSMWPAGFDGGYAFAASWNGPAPYQLALARINATSGRVSYEYYRLPEFSSEINSPQIYVHGGYVYAASAHVLYRYKVSGSGDVLDTRLASNRLANTPRFADGYALVEKEQSHAVLALQLDS